MRIEVCGGIASGKTTLAAALSEKGYAPSFERFQDNPFFEQFYANRVRYAFETEITYLLQHFSQINDAQIGTRVGVDFSLALDLAYSYVTLQPADQRTFASVLDRVLEKAEPPSLIVRLQCESAVELARIHARQRLQEMSITVDYLDALEVAIDQALASPWFERVSVIRIDSQRSDFRVDGAGRATVLHQIAAAVPAPG